MIATDAGDLDMIFPKLAGSKGRPESNPTESSQELSQALSQKLSQILPGASQPVEAISKEVSGDVSGNGLENLNKILNHAVAEKEALEKVLRGLAGPSGESDHNPVAAAQNINQILSQ